MMGKSSATYEVLYATTDATVENAVKVGEGFN